MIEGQKVREPSKQSSPSPMKKSPEKKPPSDPKRDGLRVVRPAGKLVTNANNKTEIKPFDEKRKSKSERQTSEESTQDRDDASSEEKSKNKSDDYMNEEESRTPSETQ